MFSAPLTFKLYVFCLFLCCPFLEIIYSPNSSKPNVVNIYICAFVCACVYPFSPPLRSFMIVFFLRLAAHATAPRPFPPLRRSHARETPHQQVRGGDDYDGDIIDRFLATVCLIVAFRRRGPRAYGAYVFTGFFL